jgi:hypothetical protein
MEDWREDIEALEGAYPYSPDVDLPAVAEVLHVHGFKDLSALAGVAGVRTLRVENARPSELVRLSVLTPGLETLVVGGLHVTDLGYRRGVGAPSTVVLTDHTKVERLDGIEALSSMTSLTLDNVPRIRDLRPLSALTSLRRLRIATLMSRAINGSDQLIDSLAPLKALRSLERLAFFSVKARDGDLSPLYALRKLEDVQIPLTYSTEQIARLAGVLGRGADEWPAIVPSGWRACRACGADDEVMLVGARRRRYVCRHCDAERVERHIAAFEAWRAQGAAGT